MSESVIKLKGLRKDDIPADLKVETYFDFEGTSRADSAG